MPSLTNIFWLGTKELRSFVHDYVLLGLVIWAFSFAVFAQASRAVAAACEKLVFDPMRLTDGIEPSDDKILLARPAAYSVSIDKRFKS